MAELGKISGEITFGPVAISPAAVNVLFGETAPTPPLELARQHADAFDRGRRALRGKLRSVAELFGDALFRVLEPVVEDVEENHAEALHHYERALEADRIEVRRLDGDLDRAREIRDTYRRALFQAVEELDRRDRRSRRKPNDLVVNLHEILGLPIGPF